MNKGGDFLNFLPCALSMKILITLHDPSDLVRISAVSRSWRQFVIRNGLCKHLSLRMFPQLSRVDHVNELCGPAKGHIGAGSTNFMKWEALEREHRVYAFLARQCSLLTVWDCISEATIASTTGNYQRESINNTLEESEASYWSSKGDSNPAVPETLTYKLTADICLVREIRIRPYKARSRIYSAKSVRFRLGHIKSSPDNHVDDQFSWTYTSQEFEMSQRNCLQSFKLPKPILCIGGILQIVLLGRVQRQQSDGLFYIRVSHVKVLGRPLWPAFGIQILEPSETFVLEARSYALPALPEQMYDTSSLQMRVRARDLILEDGDGGIDYGNDDEEELVD